MCIQPEVFDELDMRTFCRGCGKERAERISGDARTQVLSFLLHHLLPMDTDIRFMRALPRNCTVGMMR